MQRAGKVAWVLTKAVPAVLLKCWHLALLCPSKHPLGTHRRRQPGWEGACAEVADVCLAAVIPRAASSLLACCSAHLCAFTGTWSDLCPTRAGLLRSCSLQGFETRVCASLLCSWEPCIECDSEISCFCWSQPEETPCLVQEAASAAVQEP